MTTIENTLNCLTETEICAKYNITPAQLDKATRILNATTGEIFYQVSSQTTDAVYEVRYNAKYHKLTCTCAAGQNGVPCWHKRAAAGAAFEFRQQENIAYRKEAEEAAKHAAIQAEAHAVINARVAELTTQRNESRAAVAGLKAGKGIQQAKPFSILK